MAYYKLLALDVDGTLVGGDQVVAEETVAAIAAARGAGLAVCLATGRSYPESVGIWRQLRLDGPLEPMVLVGGALVAEPDTGRTLYQRPIPAETAREFADALNDLGYVAMALVDGWRCEADYLITERGDHHAASRDWFAKMDVRVRRLPALRDAGEGLEALRISTVVEPADAAALAEQLRRRFDGRLNAHAIVAPNYGVTIVEAHAAGATKMTALRYLAAGLRLSARQIAAAGDDINDLSMVRGAGLGVAMPQAPQVLLDAADHVAAAGLAAFVRDLAAGRLDP